MGFSSQEYCSGLLFPSPGYLPDPGILMPPALAGEFFTTSATQEAQYYIYNYCAVLCLVAQSCLSLCNPMDLALQAPLSMGILQARILEWVAVPSSRGSSQPKNLTQVSCIAGEFFTIWATNSPDFLGHPLYCWLDNILCKNDLIWVQVVIMPFRADFISLLIFLKI